MGGDFNKPYEELTKNSINTISRTTLVIGSAAMAFEEVCPDRVDLVHKNYRYKPQRARLFKGGQNVNIFKRSLVPNTCKMFKKTFPKFLTLAIFITFCVYRKLVNLLVDVEEWGQVTLLNMLTRYARTQFLDPNLGMDFAAQVSLNTPQVSFNTLQVSFNTPQVSFNAKKVSFKQTLSAF